MKNKEHKLMFETNEMEYDVLRDETIETICVEYVEKKFEKIPRKDLLLMVDCYRKVKELETAKDIATFVKAYAQGRVDERKLKAIIQPANSGRTTGGLKKFSKEHKEMTR